MEGGDAPTRAFLEHHHDPFPIRRRLHAHGLAVDQSVVAEGIPGLEVVGLLEGFGEDS